MADLTLVEALAPLGFPKMVSLPRLLAGRAPGVDRAGDPRGCMYAQDILSGAPIAESAWRQ